MDAEGRKVLISIKGSFVRHPVVIGAGAASLAALVGFNITAFLQGMQAPWLLGSVLLADMLVIGAGIFVATREVLMADNRSQATQSQLAAVVDSAMDAILTVDEAQNIVLFNRAAEQVFRIDRAQVLGTPLGRFLPPRFRAAHGAHIERFGQTGVTSRRMGDVTTLWALRADGEEFPIEASISQAGPAGQRQYTVILRDITLRKQYEDALKASQGELRELSARVLEAREEEKTLIARELHDELGQLLTALKMDLAWLRQRLPAGDAELAARAGEMGGLLDRTVASTRRISADLRPLMLDDLGLADAAAWLVEDFGKRSGVQCALRLEGIASLKMSQAVATAVYRALQESLTNIARHSGARQAWVSLCAEDGSVRLEIDDDGRGIAPEEIGKRRSLGLKGMRERFSYLGGSFEVGRAPRGGTRVAIRVPAGAREAA